MIAMADMNAAQLATWVPLALNLTEATPSIDWGDLGSRRFGEPMLQDTIARWAAEEPSAPVVRTDLAALVALDQAPSLDPSGLIFHSSRCGSTLLARSLRQIPGCVVVSEPDIVNSLLLADPAIIDDKTRVQMLRLLLRALGRRRLGDERHYVVKLSSWNVCRLDLFRQAFPDSPMIWLQRRPAEVLRSLLAHGPAWLHWREKPDVAAAIFGIAGAKLPALEPAAFYARALVAIFQAAQAAPGAMATIDHADLPDAGWSTVAPRFGMAPDADDIARMQADSRYDSKDLKPRLFERQAAEPISESLERLVAGQLDGLYRALSGRKAATPAPPRSGAAQS
jgi:hypothetical protein